MDQLAEAHELTLTAAFARAMTVASICWTDHLSHPGQALPHTPAEARLAHILLDTARTLADAYGLRTDGVETAFQVYTDTLADHVGPPHTMRWEAEAGAWFTLCGPETDIHPYLLRDAEPD